MVFRLTWLLWQMLTLQSCHSGEAARRIKNTTAAARLPPPPLLLKGSYLKCKGSWSLASLNCNSCPGLLPFTEILSSGSSAEDNRRWLLGGQLSQTRVQLGLSACRWVQGMQCAFCLTWQCFGDKHQKRQMRQLQESFSQAWLLMSGISSCLVMRQQIFTKGFSPTEKPSLNQDPSRRDFHTSFDERDYLSQALQEVRHKSKYS